MRSLHRCAVAIASVVLLLVSIASAADQPPIRIGII